VDCYTLLKLQSVIVIAAIAVFVYCVLCWVVFLRFGRYDYTLSVPVFRRLLLILCVVCDFTQEQLKTEWVLRRLTSKSTWEMVSNMGLSRLKNKT
jgi:type VI protein secretion system component VasK